MSTWSDRALVFAASLALVPLGSAWAQVPVVRDDTKSIQGTWRLASLSLDGVETPREKLPDRTLFFGGNNSFLIRERNATPKLGSVSFDPTSTPKSITWVIIRGEEEGKSLLGIYELKNEALRICLDPKGRRRPDEFRSDVGSGLSVESYVREFPSKKGEVEIVGDYEEETPDADGAKRTLDVTIERRGDTYAVTWKMNGANLYIGTGIRRNDVLSVCWLSQGQIGLSVYQIENGPRLTGYYATLGGSGVLVPNDLTPKAKAVAPRKNSDTD